MSTHPITLFAMLQAVAFFVVLVRLGTRASLLCLASLAVTWVAVLVLVSGHVEASNHALWVVPALWLAVAAVLASRHKRLEN